MTVLLLKPLSMVASMVTLVAKHLKPDLLKWSTLMRMQLQILVNQQAPLRNAKWE